MEALWRAEWIAKQADVVAALTFEAMLGVTDVFDPGQCPTKCFSCSCRFCIQTGIIIFVADIHKSRPHPGQILVAARLRALVDYPSDMRCRKNGNAISTPLIKVPK